MKNYRQTVIREIISNEQIETQEELADALRLRGINVTQATVSRDIKEMRLLKVAAENGVYKYANADMEEGRMNERFLRLLAESVVSIDYAQNIMVIKTLNGSANMAAEAIDNMKFPEILGTIAGDNTLLLVARSTEDAKFAMEKLHALVR